MIAATERARVGRSLKYLEEAMRHVQHAATELSSLPGAAEDWARVCQLRMKIDHTRALLAAHQGKQGGGRG